MTDLNSRAMQVTIFFKEKREINEGIYNMADEYFMMFQHIKAMPLEVYERLSASAAGSKPTEKEKKEERDEQADGIILVHNVSSQPALRQAAVHDAKKYSFVRWSKPPEGRRVRNRLTQSTAREYCPIR